MFKILQFIPLVLFLSGSGTATPQNLIRHTRQSGGCSLSGRIQGVCRRWSQCPTAQTALNVNKIPPIYCSYDRTDPVVCCPPQRGGGDKNLGQLRERISAQKCRETYSPETTIRVSRQDNGAQNDKGGEKEEEQLFWVSVTSGSPTKPGEFSHMAAIGWRGTGNDYDFLCGGTLISKVFVLTAAHCASVRGVAPEVVRIGGSGLDTANVDPNIRITDIHVHPQYNRKQYYHDIALLRLDAAPVQKPACLWQSPELVHKEATAIGYGHTSFAGRGSNDLLKILISIYPNELCSQFYTPDSGFENSVTESQICAGDPNKEMDTCQGDSGGPLMVKVNESNQVIPYILGVTSFGQGCAGGTPSIYVRVPSYLDWIEPIVWG